MAGGMLRQELSGGVLNVMRPLQLSIGKNVRHLVRIVGHTMLEDVRIVAKYLNTSGVREGSYE